MCIDIHDVLFVAVDSYCCLLALPLFVVVVFDVVCFWFGFVFCC